MQRAIRPDWLLRQADELAGSSGDGRGQPRNADLRRAVSAAYYALYHHLVIEATHHLLPRGAEDDQLRFARYFEHRALLLVCERIAGTSVPPRLTGWAINRLRSNNSLVDVAGTFKDLQQARHEADYDHLAPFTKPGVLAHINLAKDAIHKMDSLQGSEDLEIFLTLLIMQCGARS